MSELRPGDITDEMRRAVDMARRQGLQKDLRTLAANIRADAEGRPESSGRCCGSRTPPAS